MKHFISALSILIFACLPGSAIAQTTIGSEFLINTTTTGGQFRADVAANSYGDVVVVWTSDASGNYDVLARCYNGSGVPVTGEITVAATVEDENDPVVAVFPDGSFVVVYERDPVMGYDDVWLRRFGVDGSPLGDAFLFDGFTSTAVSDPAVVAAGDGEFLVSVTAVPHIQVRRFDAAGSPIGGAIQANVDIASSKIGSDVTLRPDKGFIVAWTSIHQDGDHYGVFCRRFDRSGTGGSETGVNDYTLAGQSYVAVGARSDGAYVITWASNGQDGSSYGVFARRFSATDVKLGTEFQVNTYVIADQTVPAIAINGQDEFTITWSSMNQDGSSGGIYACDYSAIGAALTAEYRVNTTTAGPQSNPRIGVGGQSQIIVWHGDGADPDGIGIQGQWYTAPPSSPDITVTGVVCPDEYTTGAAFPCTVTVHNEGVYAGGFDVTVYISDDSEITFEDTPLVSYPVAGLAAGADATMNPSLDIPPETPGGQFWIGAIADPEDDVRESNENNNTASRLVTYPMPDLSVSEFACPADVWDLSAAFPCTVTVHNGGSDDAGLFDVKLHLSNDDEITGADAALDSFTVAGLAEGADVTVILTDLLSTGVPSGRFWIGAVVDPDDTIIELNDDNNTTTASVTNQVPVIASLQDVHGDQGGQLHLTWWACPRDTVPDGTITEYTVWRAIDTGAGEKMLGAGALFLDEYLGLEAKPDETPPVVRNDLLGSHLMFWELVGTQPAYFMPGYAMAVPTLFDSTAVNTGFHYVQVIAHLAEPWPYFVSAVDSARSTDDLAPGALKNLIADYAAGNTALDWDDAPEPDLGHYRVYRGDEPDFVAGAGNLVAEVTNSQWTDPETEPWSHHYKVAAVDGAGNEGPAVAPTGVSDVPDGAVVYGNALHDAVPNPFNPMTLVSFELAGAGRARLAVYDVAGRLVAILVDEHRDAGRHAVSWDGTDDRGRQSAAGIYFYRLEAKGISATKRFTLVK